MNHQLQAILLKAKEDVYTRLNGGNLSRILGQGYDFAELREYASSDDIRHISWINSAKLGKPYVKKMYEERELRVAVCSMIDGRFLVGKKQETLSYLLAILGYSAYKANDLFSAFLVIGNQVQRYEATKNIHLIEKSIKESYKVKLLGTSVAYTQIANIYLESKSLLFLIGDFLNDIDLSLVAQQHEVILIIIRDASEENPILSAEYQLMNPQTNQPINQTLTKRAIKYYKRKLAEHDARLIQQCHQYGIKYSKIYGSNEVLEKLERLF